MTTYDDRRLWPGTVPPVGGAPERRPGSVRRTTSVDLVRPQGFGGPLVVTGTGRDLATGEGGAGEVVGAAHTEVTIDYPGGRVVTEVRADPWPEGLGALVGARAGSGFRKALAEAVPGLASSGSLVHQLLDDVPPGTLVSGSAMAREGLIHLAAGPSGGTAAASQADICAGWVSGGSMYDAIAETGIPLLGWGPPAPDLEPAEDPLAWHPLGPLPPMSMRRRRLIDVAGGGPGDGPAAPVLEVRTRFRDSYWEHDGTETVVHEYGVIVEVDPATWCVASAVATPGPLPAPECPGAAASAHRLVGAPVADLRPVVRQSFTGVSTCTHLNDVFRSLADVPTLWARSAAGRGAPTGT